MTLTKATSRMTVGDVINVLDYIPEAEHAAIQARTSTYDASSDIQSAVDAAEAAGGATVYFPRGRYRVESTITIDNHGVHLLGAGREVTYINNAAANTDTFHFVPSAPLSANLRDVSVGRMTLNHTNATPTGGSHVVLERTARGMVYDCMLRDHYCAVELIGTDATNWIDNVNIEAANTATLQAGSCGIRLKRRQVNMGVANAVQDTVDSLWYTRPFSTYISNVNIRGFDIGGAPALQYNIYMDSFDGVYMTNSHLGFGDRATLYIDPSQANLPCSNLQCDNIFFDGLGAVISNHCILYENTASHASTNIFYHQYTNCNIGNPSNNGALFSATTDPRFVSFTGCIVKNCGDSGLFFADGRDIAISNCLSFDVNENAGVQAHYRFENVDRVTVNGVNCSGSGDKGVWTAGGTTQVIVNGSSFEGTTGLAIQFSHTNDGDKVSGCISDKSDAVASATTIDVPLEFDAVLVTGTTNITNINTATANGRSNFEGRMVTLVFAAALTVNDTTGNLELAGNFVTTANDTLTVQWRNARWYEISRSAN